MMPQLQILSNVASPPYARPRSVWSLLLFAMSLPALAASQLEGRFNLSKPSYSAGEPVFLIFEVENKGTEPVMVQTADPLSFCGGYKIDIAGVRGQEDLGCYGGAGGSCASSDTVLQSDEKHSDRILLNRSYDLRQPGRYALRVHHELPYGPGNGDLAQLTAPGHAREIFDADLEIVIEPARESELKIQFQKYGHDLQSGDERQKIEAAQVIVNLAPPFLEETIIQMLGSARWSFLAVRGLRNLGTPSAHRALVNFVKNSEPVQAYGAYQEAIRYIGDVRDREDLPMLLETAHANPPESDSHEFAMEAAGKVGGDDAVPLLTRETKNPSIDARQSAVRALYLTGSRRAVPVLIELLRSPEERVSGTAEFGLQVLTHRVPKGVNSAGTQAFVYPKWVEWWNTHTDSATIFKYDQCGDSLPFD